MQDSLKILTNEVRYEIEFFMLLSKEATILCTCFKWMWSGVPWHAQSYAK